RTESRSCWRVSFPPFSLMVASLQSGESAVAAARSGASRREQPVDQPARGLEVAAAGEIEGIQSVIELIEGAAYLVAVGERPRLAVGFVERGAEAAEELRHRDVRLAVAVVH